MRRRFLQVDVFMAALAHICSSQSLTGVTVFGVEPDGGLEVRSFAPHEGVPEDPVCGSGNGVVAYFRSREKPVANYIARQGRCVGRDGFVRVTFRSDGVWIAGHAVVCVDGTIDS
jgi:PhzF family phenazine biosynthesis protein